MVERKLANEIAGEEGLVPEDLVGPFLPVTAQDIQVFNDIIGDELDSAFASTICCCDFCYKDFKLYWPEVAFRKLEFQTQSIELRWFLETARVNDLYTAAEMSTLRHFVSCPRCDRFDSWNLWLYEHRFSDADAIEDAIDDLLVLGGRTPFLMLEHPFAKQVLEQIRDLAVVARREPLGVRVYRARLSADVTRLKQQPAELATFGPPPADCVGEGRFNHAGYPMLYAASSLAVAASELDRPGERCLVAELCITSEISVLELAELQEGAPGYELLEALASSALLLAPNVGQGWLKHQYVFSRFVADCAHSAGFDAIRYGSTKLVAGTNIVFLEPPADFSTFAKLVAVDERPSDEADHRY